MLVAIIVFLVVKDTQAGNMPLYRTFTDAKEKGSCTSTIYSPQQRSQDLLFWYLKIHKQAIYLSDAKEVGSYTSIIYSSEQRSRRPIDIVLSLWHEHLRYHHR